MRTVIHEMRNQLAVAVANVEAFLDGKLEPTPARLRGVLQALNELDVLINDLRPNAPAAPAAMAANSRTFDACTLIANEASALEAMANEKHVSYAVSRCASTHAECQCFQGDPVRIGQIVKNVLINAIRYTPAGGSVHVDCRRWCGALVFSVRDDGPGISEADQRHIFELGFRGARASAPGSGTGLSLVKRFVEQHGGRVVVDSRLGEGTTFEITLPGMPDRAALPRVLDEDVAPNGSLS